MRPSTRQRLQQDAENFGGEVSFLNLPSHHSITSSASASSLGGISTPNAFAVARLMTRSNLVPKSTGRSPGLFALEDPADVDTSAAISVRLTWSVANQAANLGILA